jgi:hypothetical protein
MHDEKTTGTTAAQSPRTRIDDLAAAPRPLGDDELASIAGALPGLKVTWRCGSADQADEWVPIG